MKQVYKSLLLSLSILSGLNIQTVSAQSTTFNYTGTMQLYTVGAGVSSISVDCRAAAGGDYPSEGSGGLGGRVQATLAVTPGEPLYIYVGQQGADGGTGSVPPGGSNSGGGANGGSGSSSIGGAAGGGSTDVRTVSGSTLAALTSRVITAGAGGGGAWDCSADNGGVGGNATGGTGLDCSVYNSSTEGTPGGPAAGGLAGAPGGTPGGFGFGGAAYSSFYGGGGGGGWYGAGGAYSGGGCGGSSNTGTGTTAVTMTAGYQSGNGQVIINVLCVTPTGGAIVGPSTVCVGAMATLTNPTGTGGGTWTSSNALIASIGSSTGIVTGNSAGVATITYSVVLSCGSATATRTITVNPLPASITGAAGICTGSTTTLFDATPGGVWSSTFPTIATIDSTTGLVTGVTIGATNISYTLSSTGCASTAVVTVVGINGPTKVCMGDSITLTATTPSGIWSSSDSTLATVDTTGKVKGIAMGVIHISYTLTTGCTASWTVTVNPLAPVLGTDSVCIGANRYLTDIVGGGVWTSSAPAIATITSDSGRVFGAMVGITTISYTLPTGCMATTGFSVIDLPPAILGSMMACPGSTTTLVDAVAGGYWTSSDTSVAEVNGSTGIVTGLAVDTADIYYTIAPGCTISTTITINPLPAPITGLDAICPGTTDTLNDPTLYGSWSTTTPSITSVDTLGVVTALLASGDGIIRYTLPVTGCYQTKTITVDPLPVPILTYNWVYATLYATPGYASYQWYDSTIGLIPGATSPSIATSGTDYYYVVVTDSGGCKGASAAFYYNITMTGVKNTTNNIAVRVYPNPANNIVYIESAVKLRAVISSIEGKTVQEQANATEMNISRLPAGMYLLSLYGADGTRLAVQKLVKE